MKKFILPDKDELARLAGVRFTDRELAELSELMTIWTDSQYEVPDFMLLDAAQRTPRRTKLEVRRAFIDAVEAVWRERRRKRGRGSA